MCADAQATGVLLRDRRRKEYHRVEQNCFSVCLFVCLFVCVCHNEKKVPYEWQP